MKNKFFLLLSILVSQKVAKVQSNSIQEKFQVPGNSDGMSHISQTFMKEPGQRIVTKEPEHAFLFRIPGSFPEVRIKVLGISIFFPFRKPSK